MKNYLAYKDQIEGFTQVADVVKTEEKIAASLIGNLRLKSANLDMYQMHIKDILDRLSLFQHIKTDVKIRGKRALVILTSDKGLTGGLWRRLVDEFLKTAQHEYPVIISYGLKGEKYLKEEKKDIEKSFDNDGDIFPYIIDLFRQGLFSQVDILYPKFVSLSEHIPVIIPFLPFSFKSAVKMPTEKQTKFVDLGFPIIDPLRSGSKIFDSLMQKYESSYFQKIVTEGKLSECAARTVSMEHANTKTEELIKNLALDYRKERRRSLTQKQLESFIAHKII